MSIRAELLAIEALRAHLLLKLPAKVTSINAERAAALKAPRAGPYIVTGDILLGIVPGAEAAVSTPLGSRTTAQMVTSITAAAISGVTASADSLDRLTVTASAAPTENTPSCVSLGIATAAGINRAFGWDDGGQKVVRSALVAPMERAVSDGEPEGAVDLGTGFWIVLGQRRTEADANVHKNLHHVAINASLYVAEPNGSMAASKELVGSAVRAVREAIADDHSLGGTVLLCRIPQVTFSPMTFRFAGQGASPLMSEALMTFRISLHERP